MRKRKRRTVVVNLLPQDWRGEGSVQKVGRAEVRTKGTNDVRK